MLNSVLGLPTATGDPAQITIGGLMFSFDMTNCCTTDGNSVFPGYPANSEVIGNAWYLQVANASGEPLAGNFSVTENVMTVSATPGINSPFGTFTWSTNSSGGFVDNIFVAFNNVGFAGFQTIQNFAINGAAANSFNQFYIYSNGLKVANPWPTGP